MSKKTSIARLSIISNVFLITIKLIVGLIGGSVSIISEAIHSTMDLVAAIIAYFSVKVSDNPPDKRHPYGHGKIENISGVIEALLIFVASFWIIFEAIKKIISKEPIDSIGLGFIVMFISCVVNIIVSRKLYKVAKETDSVALEADALHLKADVYTSAGVGVGLLLIWITGLYFLDPIVAIVVAIFIMIEAFGMLKTAFAPLLDVNLPDDEIKTITECIKSMTWGCIDFHQLRTRKAGNKRYVDLHLEVPQKFTVAEAHDLCDKIEKAIEAKIPKIEIHIHVEPCPKMCDTCSSYQEYHD